MCTVEGGMQRLGLPFLKKQHQQNYCISTGYTINFFVCTGASSLVEVTLSQILSGRRLETLTMAITGSQLSRLSQVFDIIVWE